MKKKKDSQSLENSKCKKKYDWMKNHMPTAFIQTLINNKKAKRKKKLE